VSNTDNRRMELLELEIRSQGQFLEQLRTGAAGLSGRAARSDSATPSRVTTPEIQELERQLALRRKDAEIIARGQPGEVIRVSERDDTGRMVTNTYGDEQAAHAVWTPFMNALQTGRFVRPK
jgi:hypothetical protein